MGFAKPHEDVHILVEVSQEFNAPASQLLALFNKAGHQEMEDKVNVNVNCSCWSHTKPSRVLCFSRSIKFITLAKVFNCSAEKKSPAICFKATIELLYILYIRVHIIEIIIYIYIP